MAGQQIYGCLKDGITWFVQPASPEFGKVQIADLLARLAISGGLGSSERLPAGLAAFPPLALVLLPELFEPGHWLVGVVFPCALLVGTWARAQLLPDRQGNRHPVGEAACGVAGAAAQRDGGLQARPGSAHAHHGSHVPALLVRVACACT